MTRIPRGFFDDPTEWRHHGLGLVQREIDLGRRVHVWHPSLVWVTGLRAIHDHRFDLRSTVLHGAIADQRWDVIPAPAGELADAECWAIAHAKVQTGEDSERLFSALVRPLCATLHHRGASYIVPRRCFHSTMVAGLTVTLVERWGFDGEPARVLSQHKGADFDPAVPVSSAISGAHGHRARDDAAIASVLERARVELERRAS